MVTLKDIQRVSTFLEGVIHPTPLILSQTLNKHQGSKVYLKLESLQKTGSFKLRGAYNKIIHLPSARRSQGVITASAGNHAQGVAYAASLFSLPALIVMPERTPLIKISATKNHGAEVVLRGNNFDEACIYARQLMEERNLTFIPPFDDEEVIAGQGTIGLEILRNLPNVNTVIVPIGGGGLISGTAIALKETNSHVRVIGVEAKGAASMHHSIQNGTIKEIEMVKTIADGISIKQPGKITFPLVQRYVDEIVLVEEEEIAEAVLTFMEKEKLLVEGAGAVPLAALLGDRVNIPNGQVVLVISGGNIDVNIIARIIEKGLVKSGRLLRLSLELEDVPGTLHRLTSIIAQKQANILHIIHDRLGKTLPIGVTNLELDLETRSREHSQEVIAVLEADGYFPCLIQGLQEEKL